MSGLYFGATTETVLAKVQNTNIDESVIQLDIPQTMSDSYDYIIGEMPDKMSDPIDIGEITGHVLVSSANDGQTTIDPGQEVYLSATNMHLFLNPVCSPPINNVTTEMVLGTDYTLPVVGGAPVFSPLVKASTVVANYHTTWEGNEGLGVLRSLLEEDCALIILNAIGIANNPDLLSNVTPRREAWEKKIKKLQAGELTPRGLQAIKLQNEVGTNDTSNFATISRFKRG